MNPVDPAAGETVQRASTPSLRIWSSKSWPAGATLQLLQKAQQTMGLQERDRDEEEHRRRRLSRLASRCWALLLVRIYECLPLLCPQCSKPMRILAFIEDPPVIERILHHLGEPTQPPQVLPARAPPQAELGFSPSAAAAPAEWPEMDQTAGRDDAGWD